MGPIVSSSKARAAELDMSLLERLFERPLYAEFMKKASPNFQRYRVAEIPSTSLHCINLVKVSHHIFVCSAMSDFTLELSKSPCHPHASLGTFLQWLSRTMRPQWSLNMVRASQPRVPSQIHWNRNTGRMHQWGKIVIARTPFFSLSFGAKRASWYNTGEISQVVEVIKSLLSEGHSCQPHLHQKDIGVMSPWREQVWKLRERLRKEKLNAVDVGTVEVGLYILIVIDVSLTG